MPTPRVTRARALAVQLAGAGIAATHDPSEVAGKAPCVLVGPPRLAFDVGDASTATWRLLVIAGTTTQLPAWEQIDALLAQLADELAVETADPVAWAEGPGTDPRPAYAVTYTETVE